MLIIAATRMHRSLVDFASGSSDVYDAHFLSLFPFSAADGRFRVHGNPQMNNLASPKTKRTSTPSSALDRVEVAIHPAINSHPTSLTNDDDSPTHHQHK